MLHHRIYRTTLTAVSMLALTGIGVAVVSGCNSKPPPQPEIVTAGTSGATDSEEQSVDLAKGQKLQVRLKSTPNASWRMGGTDFGGDVVEVVDHKTEADSATAEEGGSWDVFNLQAKKPGQSHLEFANQSLERTTPTKRLKLDVTVR
jgi:hypothetical protein